MIFKKKYLLNKIRELEKALSIDKFNCYTSYALDKLISARDARYNACNFGYRYLYYIDVNDLKKINDSAGHAAGDEYLQSIIAFLKINLGEAIYRIGGDEFIVLSNEKDESIRSNKSFSYGICSLYNPHKILTFKEALHKAESKMYNRKPLKLIVRSDELNIQQLLLDLKSIENKTKTIEQFIEIIEIKYK